MLQRNMVRVAFASILLLVASQNARAQTISTGALDGQVRDQDGRFMGDVSVILTTQEGTGARSISTSHDGMFQFALLPPGTYTVVAERLGYRPKRIEGVTVHAGRGVLLDIALTLTPPPVQSADVVQYTQFAGASRGGVSQFVSPFAVRALPWERRELTDLVSLSTASTNALEIEGLPGSFTSVILDGVAYSPAQHRHLREAPTVTAIPLSAIQSAEIVTGDAGPEWSGFAGGALAGQTRRGTSRFNAEAFGAWSALRSSKFFDASQVSGNSLWGGLTLAGPLIADTAHYFLALEARQLDLPLPRQAEFNNAIDQELVSVGNSYGVDLEGYTRPFVLRAASLSGFGRFDWQLTSNNALSVRAGFGNVPGPGADAATAAATFPRTFAKGRDILVSTSLTSVFKQDWSHELRVGVLRSTRDYDPVDADPDALTGTQIVAGGLRVGPDPRLPGRFQRTSFTTSQSLQIPSSEHRFKIGLESEVSTHDDDYAYAGSGDFTFGGPTEFGAGRGLFYQSLNGDPRARYTTFRIGGFLEDAWRATPDLQVTAGVRVDLNTIPRSKIKRHHNWFGYTGLANDSISSRVVSVLPRLGLVWDVGNQGRWIVRANAGTYEGAFESSTTSELVTLDRDAGVRRLVGNLGSTWPDVPPLGQNPNRVGELAILAEDFRAPRSSRVSFGVSHRIGAASMLHLSGAYRNTDFLARRADLNLLTTPAATDQHGRPLYGTLLQMGSLVAPLSTNRRFSDFDRVSALNSDGWSRYLGLTAAFERDGSGNLAWFGSYTFSHTTDNWFGARNGGPTGQLLPFPEGGPENWDEDVSDFDVPHRIAAGLEIRGSGSLQPRLAALYRYRSGYAFTPGFRDGVDVNADGSGNNDPAFVDDALPGMSDLLQEWSCLQDQAGLFVARNSCREPGVHSLDLRLGFTFNPSAGFAAEIFVDGINLIESSVGRLDQALYLIDPNGNLSSQPSATVNLPLTPNPNFGKPLARFNTGRMLRIGLQVNH